MVVVAGAEAGTGAGVEDAGDAEEDVAAAVYEVPTQVDKKSMAL